MQVESRREPVPAMIQGVRRRSGRTGFGKLQREANRRRQAAQWMMVASIAALAALVAVCYRVLSG